MVDPSIRNGSLVSRDTENASCHGSAQLTDIEKGESPYDHVTAFPNTWSKIRYQFREPLAEFFGTMLLVIFGVGATLQAGLSATVCPSNAPNSNVGSICVPSPPNYSMPALGWASGVALGVWLAGGISGGHINPAVTVALSSFRRFPLKKVPVYIVSQILGAFIGTLLLYAIYYRDINTFEGVGVRTLTGPTASGSWFATYANSSMSDASSFFDEFFITFVFLFALLSLSDKRNNAPPPGVVPLALFVLILAIGIGLGFNTGYALNPARDLGPRLVSAIFYGREVFTYRHQYWIWTPILATILGALTGTFIYDAFFFTGSESIINRPNKEALQEHAHAPNGSRDKVPAGADAPEPV